MRDAFPPSGIRYTPGARRVACSVRAASASAARVASLCSAASGKRKMDPVEISTVATLAIHDSSVLRTFSARPWSEHDSSPAIHSEAS